MQVKTRAIVLNSLKYGESQVIVDLFTEAHGSVVNLINFLEIVNIVTINFHEHIGFLHEQLGKLLNDI